MEMKDLRKKMDNLWKIAKKDLDKALKDTSTLAKKGEVYLKDVSEKGKDKVEALTLSLKREKMYYELGKALSALPKSKWPKNTKAGNINSEIKKMSRQIKERS